MRDEVVLIIDTNSNYSDVWAPCFSRLDKYASNIKKYVSRFLDEAEYSFCKFIKGPEKTFNLDNNLFIISKDDPNFFAQQASIWKTRDFQKVFEAAPAENTRMQHEPGGSKICQELDLGGLQYFSNTNKRGIHHYDSEIYPYIATAVVKGLWNLSEYPVEIGDIMSEFKIDPSKRGWR